MDDIIFWTRNDDDIHDLAMDFLEFGVDLEQEYDAAVFMGVTLKIDLKIGLLEMKQTGLTQCVIETVAMDDSVPKGKFTPSEANLLVKDKNDEPVSGMFSYRRVVGILLYLYGYTCTYVSLSVKIFAWYMCSPKQYHE